MDEWTKWDELKQWIASYRDQHQIKNSGVGNMKGDIRTL